MNSPLTRTGFVLLVVLVGVVGVALVWRWDAEDTVLARVASGGDLRIGYAVEAPYALVTPEGRVSGESPEVARLVAARMGVKRIRWVQTSFDSLILELQNGRFDVVAAGLFITPERVRQVYFSPPTLRVGAGLLVPAGNPSNLTSYRAVVAASGLRVAVLAGSIEERRLRLRGLPPERLLSVPDAAAGRAALESGAAGVLALSLPTIRWMAKDSGGALEAVAVPGREAADAPVVPFYSGFAFSRRHKALMEAWSQAQGEVVGGPAHREVLAALGLGPDDLPRSPEGEARP